MGNLEQIATETISAEFIFTSTPYEHIQNRTKSGNRKLYFFCFYFAKKNLDLVYFLRNTKMTISQLLVIRFSFCLSFWIPSSKLFISSLMNHYSKVTGLAAILKKDVFYIEFSVFFAKHGINSLLHVRFSHCLNFNIILINVMYVAYFLCIQIHKSRHFKMATISS